MPWWGAGGVRASTHRPGTALSPPGSGRGSSWGVRFSPAGQPPPSFGNDGPTAGSWPNRHTGGSVPSGASWGGRGAALLWPARCWGCRLPTCLPLTVVFPPEFQICLGFAVIWPGARLGRAGTACRMQPRCRVGGRAERGGLPAGSPLRGFGVQGSAEGVFASVVALVPDLKHHRGVPTLLLSQLPPPSSSAMCVPGEGFGVTPRGAATRTGTHKHPLTYPPPPQGSQAGTPWMGWGRWHAPEGDPSEGSGSRGVTVAAPAGVKSRPAAPLGRPRQRERVRIRPVWLRRPPYRLIAPSPLSRATPRAAFPRPGSPAVLSPWAGAVGVPHLPLTAKRATPPQPASPGTPSPGRDFLGKVPAGGTRLRQGRPWRWWVPLAWFRHPAPWTPGDVAVGVLPACGGELEPRTLPGASAPWVGGFRVGGGVPSPKWRGGLCKLRPTLDLGVVVGFGLVWGVRWKLGKE